MMQLFPVTETGIVISKVEVRSKVSDLQAKAEKSATVRTLPIRAVTQEVSGSKVNIGALKNCRDQHRQ